MLEFDFLKPSLLNLLIVGLMAIVFITLAKFVVNKFDNVATRPFKEVVNAV